MQLLLGFSWEKGFGAFSLCRGLQFPQNTAVLSPKKGSFDSSSEISIHLFTQLLNKCAELLLCAGLRGGLDRICRACSLPVGTQGRELLGNVPLQCRPTTSKRLLCMLSLLLHFECIFQPLQTWLHPHHSPEATFAKSTNDLITCQT